MKHFEMGKILGSPAQATIDEYEGEERAYAEVLWRGPSGKDIRLRAACRNGIDYEKLVVKPMKRELIKQIALRGYVDSSQVRIKDRPVRIIGGYVADTTYRAKVVYLDPEFGRIESKRSFKAEKDADHVAMVEGFMTLVDLMEEMGATKNYEGVLS